MNIDPVYLGSSSGNKKVWLQAVCNKYGDFRVAMSYRNQQGDHIWHLAKKEMTVMHWWERNSEALLKMNHRQILPYEIIIDLDDVDSIKGVWELCDFLDDNNVKYYCFHTGSKGYHIHVINKLLAFFDKETREIYRKKFYERLPVKVDEMKAYDHTLIAMEYTEHWKTGKVKVLKRCNK